MDYTQFLQKPGETLSLPYFTGTTVCDDKLSYRLRESLEPGWYKFQKSGRYLTVESKIDPEFDAWKLPRLTGYLFNGRLISNEFQGRLYGLPTDVDLPKFTPISARKWFDGHLLFYGQEFESEADLHVRQAFEEDGAIDQLKGVTPALAHTFLVESTQLALAREKIEREKRVAEITRWQESLEGRISLALSHTGAQLVSWRRHGQGQAVVRYQLGGQRFECVIDTNSLQILDAGICLSGADEELNLASLPSAVREAVRTGQLHVFRHV